MQKHLCNRDSPDKQKSQLQGSLDTESPWVAFKSNPVDENCQSEKIKCSQKLWSNELNS